MRRFFWAALIALSTLLGSLAIAQQPPAAAPAAAPGYATNFSIQELMLSIVDPVGDAIFDSVSVSITAAGSKETRPRTDADVRSRSASTALRSMKTMT